MVKKTLFAVCIALTLAWAVPASADVILFDPDGAAGAFAPQRANTFDMAVGNSIAIGGDATSQVGDRITVFYQANLAQVVGPDPTFNNGTGDLYFTATAGFGEIVTAASFSPATNTGSITFNFDPTNPVNFFNLYVDCDPASLPCNTNTDINPATNDSGHNLDGVCFVCGDLILQGHIIGYIAPATFTSSGFGGNLDQSGATLPDTLNGDQYPDIDTLTGGGGFNVLIQVDSYNAAYFPNISPGQVIGFATANGTTTLPFLQADPSRCFLSTSGGYVGDVDPYAGPCVGGFDGATLASVGRINGFDGPNTILQTDANISFQLVPEPASLALLGLGLLGTAAAVRRRSRQQARTQA